MKTQKEVGITLERKKQMHLDASLRSQQNLLLIEIGQLRNSIFFSSFNYYHS